MLRILIVFAVTSLTQGDINRFVIRGEQSIIKKTPYQALLLHREPGSSHYSPTGAGAIISKNFILTTPHPVSYPGSYRVRIGSAYAAKGGTVINVKKIIKHPKSRVIDYDFALLQLETPIKEFTRTINKIPLAPPDYELVVGSMAKVSGFGTVSEGGNMSDILLHAEVPLFDFKLCGQRYGGNKITPRMFCTGHSEVPVPDACQGAQIVISLHFSSFINASIS
jgi:hypothetical protein